MLGGCAHPAGVSGEGALQAWATLELGKPKARGGLTTGALCRLGTQLRRTQGLLPPSPTGILGWEGRGRC